MLLWAAMPTNTSPFSFSLIATTFRFVLCVCQRSTNSFTSLHLSFINQVQPKRRRLPKLILQKTTAMSQLKLSKLIIWKLMCIWCQLTYDLLWNTMVLSRTFDGMEVKALPLKVGSPIHSSPLTKYIKCFLVVINWIDNKRGWIRHQTLSIPEESSLGFD